MPTLEQQISRLSSQVSEIHQMLHAKSKPRWVKVGAVTELTGWDHKKMQWARRNGIIDSKKTSDGILYDLNSINENFIKKPS
jgi:hypothetical protein